MTERFDLLICGGGLAGLSAALQVLKQRPQTRVAVIERQTFPLPEAAHKVGESTVEIGAHYFAEVLGLRDHFVNEQLPKLGLRYFFGAEDEDRALLARRCEMGGNEFLPSKSYQLDRGRLENYLAEAVTQAGGTLFSGQRVREMALADDEQDHVVQVEHDGQRHTLQARWIFDASGRAGFLKRQLGLASESPHRAHAVWFRINERLRIDDHCTDHGWQARHHHAGQRWLSTVHLMGAGYWVWFIPLASGATSVGIVVDADLHPYEEIKNFELACTWLDRHEPLAASMVREQAHHLLDFAGYRRYSYDCKQLFADRWALLGEAGFFLDPFYSPGSDFIAMGNTIAVDLLRRDLDGEAGIAQRAGLMDGVFHSLFANHLNIYHRQYPLFANAKVMATKVVWDFAYYWAVPAHLFFHEQLTNPTIYARCRQELELIAALGAEVQECFRRWHAVDNDPFAGNYIDVPTMPIMRQLNAALLDDLNDAESIARLRQHMQLLQALAGELRDWLAEHDSAVVLEDLPLLQACPAGDGSLLAPLWHGLFGVTA